MIDLTETKDDIKKQLDSFKVEIIKIVDDRVESKFVDLQPKQVVDYSSEPDFQVPDFQVDSNEDASLGNDVELKNERRLQEFKKNDEEGIDFLPVRFESDASIHVDEDVIKKPRKSPKIKKTNMPVPKKKKRLESDEEKNEDLESGREKKKKNKDKKEEILESEEEKNGDSESSKEKKKKGKKISESDKEKNEDSESGKEKKGKRTLESGEHKKNVKKKRNSEKNEEVAQETRTGGN